MTSCHNIVFLHLLLPQHHDLSGHGLQQTAAVASGVLTLAFGAFNQPVFFQQMLDWIEI